MQVRQILSKFLGPLGLENSSIAGAFFFFLNLSFPLFGMEKESELASLRVPTNMRDPEQGYMGTTDRSVGDPLARIGPSGVEKTSCSATSKTRSS